MSKPNCIELFTGAGGMMLGIEQAGFNSLFANEIHSDPVKTLKRNFPAIPIIEGEIQNFSASKLFELAGINKKMMNHVDLIAGGLPCQGFSTAGLKDKTDPRNNLIGEYLRIVKEIQPRYFILENVTGLKTLHNGKLHENILFEIDKTGYQFKDKVLYAPDYGVPQMRKRLIIIGSKNGKVPTHPEPSFSSDNKNLFNQNLPKYVTVSDAINDLPQIQQGESGVHYKSKPKSGYQQLMRKNYNGLITNHIAGKHRLKTMEYFSLIPPGGNVMDIPEELRKKKQGVQRWPLNGLSRTITTEPSDFLHPTIDRIPTIREMARIQSSPDNFEFLGQRTTGNKMRRLGYCAQSQQVGNIENQVASSSQS